MLKPRIPKEEFVARVRGVQEAMAERGLELCFVYGDEYRREHIRYLSNYWPIFERAGMMIPREGAPVLLAGPECERVAHEMSAWDDIRIVREFSCVTVPTEIDYPLSSFTSFRDVFNDLGGRKKVSTIGMVGRDAMDVPTFSSIMGAFGDAAIVDAGEVLTRLRLIKSMAEIECLGEAARVADRAYEALVAACVPGRTELYAAGAAEHTARLEGAEAVPFIVFGSGERGNTIVGRPTQKLIEDGDTIMAALAVQYEGYIATVSFPFVAGREPDDRQRRVIDALVRAEEAAMPRLGPGLPAREFVKAVRNHFRASNLAQYDVYPPLHGCGCAEAESPYPDEASDFEFEPGMTVNVDISLFGHPAGGNRIEEGFVVTSSGVRAMSPLVRRLCWEWLEAHNRPESAD